MARYLSSSPRRRPMDSRLRDTTAIVGMGQTEFSKAAGRSETQLAAEAIVAALADAGLTTSDVDGLVSYTIDPVEETELARGLGILEIGFSSRVPYGGGGSQGGVGRAGGGAGSGWPTVPSRRAPVPGSDGPVSVVRPPRRTLVRPRCSGARPSES